MSFFKKPFVAVLVSIILIAAATYLSVSAKLGRECQRVTDGFYSGELADGTDEQSIYGQLNVILGLSDDLSILASGYSVDTAALDAARSDMQLAFTYSRSSISYVYYTYDSLVREFKSLSAALPSAGISAQDQSAADTLLEELSAAQGVIRASGYNDSVRDYLRGYNSFPTSLMGELAGVDAPQYFS